MYTLRAKRSHTHAKDPAGHSVDYGKHQPNPAFTKRVKVSLQNAEVGHDTEEESEEEGGGLGGG